mmetsp:Transcript_85856/g.191916  ORF Transcript_85856/g.191916 Transcript_85856/m.191916 type:complete len:277 (+) Transcript_85856:67-897(+)
MATTTECVEFAFKVPDCAPGTTLRVPAPDGVTLELPLPGNIMPGDKLHMAKGEDGSWTISKAVREKKAEASAPTPSRNDPATWRSPQALEADLAGKGVVRVRLETSKGPICVRVVPDWAPLGAERFLHLVDSGHFSEKIAIYRGIPGGLIQFGVVKSTDPRSGRYEPIADDPLIGVPFEEGSLVFAAAGSGTRTATLCLFLGDFRSQLGRNQPETPIGKVCPESMATLHKIFTGYGDIPQCGGKGPDPERLEKEGNVYIMKEFPECDFVTGASRIA